MELISKKKLLETIEPMVGKFDDDGEFWWSRESILRAINNAPTVEEREEKELDAFHNKLGYRRHLMGGINLRKKAEADKWAHSRRKR